jgi:hypothetical protein
MLLPITASATIRNLSSGNLPYTTQAHGDTIRVSGYGGTTISSATNGIWVKHNVFIQLQVRTFWKSGVEYNDTLQCAGTCDSVHDYAGDTLEFGTDYGDSYYGLKMESISLTDVRVHGGTILHGVSNCGVSGSDTAYTCSGVQVRGCYGLFMDSVDVIVGGFNGKCIYTDGTQGYKNFEIRGGHYRHDGCGYTDREWDAEIFYLAKPSTGLSGGEFHFKAYGVHVDNAIHGVFANGGLQYIYDCTVTIDARNDLYAYPQGNYLHGTTNAYAFAGGPFGGSKIYNNVVYTDSNYAGLDGGIIIGGVPAENNNDDTVWIYGNKIYGHRGLDSHYGYMNCKGAKSKGGNHRYQIYDNEFYLTVDTDSTELGGSNFRGRSAIGVDWYAGVNGAVGSDTNVVFYNNYIEVRSVSDTGIADVIGLRMRDDFGTDRGNGWYGNTIITSREIYSLGGYSPYGRNFLVVSDTVGDTGTATDWRTFYCPSSGAYNNVFRDLYYDGVSDTSMVWVGGGSNSDISLERTLDVHVKGASGQAVSGAACSTWNDYDLLLWADTTDASGDVAGLVSYWYESYAGDSTAFNDFTIKVIKSGDSAMDSTFTVGYTAAGGVDTLTLAATGALPLTIQGTTLKDVTVGKP